ncbi:MAG: helix-turn-helix transcriptional regulator [Clostridiales bacterium]|nr:helix-turn-helix transcriptional regulator [Clostridiales bacterium]
MRYNEQERSISRSFDFMPLGQAIKHAREARGITREQLAEMLDYAPRHIQSIENEGQHPSLQLLVHLVTMFDIPVDAYIHPQHAAQSSTVRLQLDATLALLSEKELSIIEATARALLSARSADNQ